MRYNIRVCTISPVWELVLGRQLHHSTNINVMAHSCVILKIIHEKEIQKKIKSMIYSK